MSFIGEEGGGKGGRSSNGKEEEVRKRLEQGRRADEDGRKKLEDGRREDKDGRRVNNEKGGASKGGGRSKGSLVSKELMGSSLQNSQKVNWKQLGLREMTPRKDDKSATGGEEQLRRVPYLQVSNKTGYNVTNSQSHVLGPLHFI